MKRQVGLSLAALRAGPQVRATNLSFIICPIVRDPKTVPCWLAEYKGVVYYLGRRVSPKISIRLN